MEYKETIAVFESKHIRRYYDSVNEEWYFSLVDIVAALTDSANATDYLKKIRKRDEELNFYLGTNCPQVDMQTASGKKRIFREALKLKARDITKKARITGPKNSGRTELKTPNGYIFQFLSPILYFNVLHFNSFLAQ